MLQPTMAAQYLNNIRILVSVTVTLHMVAGQAGEKSGKKGHIEQTIRNNGQQSTHSPQSPASPLSPLL